MNEGAKAVQVKSGEGGRGEGVPGWVLPVAGLAAFGILAGAYFLGLVGDRALAAVASAVFAAVLVAIAVRAGLERSSSQIRAAVMAYAAAFGLIGLYPAYVELVPGEPAATGELGAAQRAMELPSGGSYRLVISAPLSAGREARINYRLRVGDEALEGVLERVTTYQRVRRGGAVPVAEDHNVSAHEVTAPSGAPSVTLDSVSNEASGTLLTVRAFKIVPPWVVYLLMGLVLAAGTYLEGRLSASGALSMTGAAALLFGVLLKTTNPAAVLGPVLGSALLAAGGGALAGSVLGSVGRKLFASKEAGEGGGRGLKR